MDPLIGRVEQNIQQRKLFKAGQGILVAVSGGLDSIVLLHALYSLSGKAKWKLAVAHLNHQLRGRAADLDAALVGSTARELGLRCAVGTADVRRLAVRQKLSLEMAARKARHEFLARTARRFGFRSIALAHHADDQIESILMRLLRGSGGEGLAGMKWRNPSPADAKIELTRPLLNLSKRELKHFTSLHDLAFREDATNLSLDILRNRIRHELLPLLRRRYQSGVDKTLLRVSEIVGAEADNAITAARSWLGSKRALARRQRFDQLPIAVQRRALQIQLAEHGIAPGFDMLESLRTKPNRPVTVPATTGHKASPGRQIMRTEDGRIRLLPISTYAFNRGSCRVTLKGRSGSLEFEGLKLHWRLTDDTGASRARGHLGCEWFDADTIGPRITLRHWEQGDRFQPIGMAQSAKLQNMFTNMKIPRDRRHQLVVGEAENGLIFWVEGLRISERFKLKSGTKRRLEWRWKRAGIQA